MTDGQKPNILGVDTTTYHVKNVERAKRFYRDVIGLPLASEFEFRGQRAMASCSQ